MKTARNADTSWVWFFRVVLIVVILSTINAWRIVGTEREAFLAAFPGAEGWPLRLMLATTVAGVVAKIGLWFWQRWAVWLTAGCGVALLVLDWIARAPLAHQATVVVTTLIVLALVLRLRAHFRA